MRLKYLPFLAAIILLAAAIWAGINAVNADAHRWSEAVATRQITSFIREWQCKNSLFKSCDQVVSPIPMPYGAHSWKWGPGVYYYQSFAFTSWQCKSWGIIASHDIKDPSGRLLRKGNTVYSYGHSCSKD